MKPTITWILIADGARARVLEHKGPGKGLNEVPGLEFADDHLRSGDVMADRPGRSFDSNNTSRSAMQPQTDPIDKREADFVSALAVMLDEKLQQGAFDQLILTAAPRAMGDLRKALTPQLRAKITAELPKDLTHIPNSDMAKHLEEVLAV